LNVEQDCDIQDGGIEAADVLKTLNVEQDCKDEVTFRMLTDYIH